MSQLLRQQYLQQLERNIKLSNYSSPVQTPSTLHNVTFREPSLQGSKQIRAGRDKYLQEFKSRSRSNSNKRQPPAQAPRRSRVPELAPQVSQQVQSKLDMTMNSSFSSIQTLHRQHEPSIQIDLELQALQIKQQQAEQQQLRGLTKLIGIFQSTQAGKAFSQLSRVCEHRETQERAVISQFTRKTKIKFISLWL